MLFLVKLTSANLNLLFCLQPIKMHATKLSRDQFYFGPQGNHSQFHMPLLLIIKRDKIKKNVGMVRNGREHDVG